jgi:ABC-type spermidine/putrescine transport system permease subunit II
VSRISIPWLAITSSAVLLFLYAPLVVATLYAFNSGSSLGWPIEGFSLRWFERMFADRAFREALTTSFEAAVSTAVLATVIGTMASFSFSRYRTRTAGAAQTLGRLPAMLPPLFVGIGFVVLMRILTWSPGLPTIVAGHTVVALPWVILVVLARLRTYDVELEAAARDLGASPRQALLRVTLPIVAPAIVGAALLAFSWSFDETLITIFTSGTESTVPMFILGKLRRLIDPSGNAVAVILLVIPWIAFGAAALFLRRSGGLTAVLGQRVR